MAEKPNILIAVPAYGGSVKTGFFRSFVKLTRALVQTEVQFDQRDLDIADIAFARNSFASTVMQETERTHLLFIDSDMIFEPKTIFKMLMAGRPVIGCICPKRSTSLAINIRNRTIPQFDADGIAPVDDVGTGILLLERVVLERLASAPGLRKQTGPEIQTRGLQTLFGFFDRIDDNGVLLGEDYSFSLRLRQSGVPSFAILDETIGHVGEVAYRLPLNLFDTLAPASYGATQPKASQLPATNLQSAGSKTNSG